MKKMNHPLRTRVTALLLALVCVLGLLPATALAASDTVKLERFGMSGVSYESAALGRCSLHEMYFSGGNKTSVGFCGTKGGGMGSSLIGQTWGNKTPVSDPTVLTMMAYYYAHSTGVFTDEAKALGVDNIWDGGYTWYMNAWVQACIWRYQQGSMGDPAVACAEELMAVFNSLEGTHYTSIDEEKDGRSFRDRAQYILDLGQQGVWGECTAYEYGFTGAGSSAHPASSVQKIILGELEVKTKDTYTLIVKKVDSKNPTKGLSGAKFHIESESGSFSKDVTTGSDGTATLENLTPGTYAVTETDPPAGYEIDNAGPEYVVLPGNGNNTVTVTFRDTPTITSEGSIRKVDADDPTKGLAGAIIKITGVDNNFSGTFMTREGGYITDIPWDTMPIGSYTAEEMTPPEGYTKSTDQNKIKQGLTSSNGLYTTDENGQIYLRKLNPNTYVVIEVETIDGYLLDAAPQTVVVSEADTQVLTFTNMPLGGLLVKKMDSATKEPLADVIFKITRTDGTVVGNSNGEFRTDERGFISLPDLEPGGYIVREVQAKPGYLLDDTPHAVEIKDHQTYTLEVFNQPLGNLIINKLSSLDNSPLEGVKFQIKYANGQVVDNKNGQMSSNGIYYTDRNGQIILSGITGSIVVTELETIPGYRIDPNTRTQTLVVNPNDTQTINFYNTPTTTLIIRKFIEGTENEPLSGVAFRVVDGAGAAVGPDDGLYYTDKSGEIVLHGIEPGTVVIAREVKTVEGFVLDGTPQDIKIEAGHVQQLTFWNKRAGTLVIQKKDKVSGAFIAGAEFQLTYANGGFVDNDNGHLSSNGIYTTDDKGEIRVSGVVGTMVAKETKPAPGYVIDQTTQTQTVTVNPMDTQTLTFLNDPLCSLTLTKLDSVTGKPVPGTEFTVKDGDGNVLGRYVTGKDGTVVVTGLVPGSTVVVAESRVPSGYVLDTTPKTIIVKNGGNSVSSGGSSSGGNGNTSGNGNDLTFENDPKMTLTIHKYIEGTANEPLAGVAFKVVDGSGKPLNPDGGIYYTNNAGEIVLEGLEPGTTITAQEIKTVDGYVLDGRPQSIKIEAGKAQNLTFWNKPAGSLIIRKLDKQTGKPLAGVEFLVTDSTGAVVGPNNGYYTTDKDSCYF